MSLLAWASVLVTLVIEVRILWGRRIQSRVLDPLVALLDAGGRRPGLRSPHADVWVVGLRHGRPVRVGLLERSGEGGPLWKATVDLACESTAFFDLGSRDGPESYVAQVSNPALRAAVRRVSTPAVAVPAAGGAIDQTTRRPSLPLETARAVLNHAEKVARLAVGCGQATWSDTPGPVSGT